MSTEKPAGYRPIPGSELPSEVDSTWVKAELDGKELPLLEASALPWTDRVRVKVTLDTGRDFYPWREGCAHTDDSGRVYV